MEEIRDKNGMTEAEVIADSRSDKYPRPSLTADIVILTGTGEEGKYRLLMIKRGGHPYFGCWALPGGFANKGETIEQTAARELEEETGINAETSGLDLQLTGIYSAPGRDPRGWTVSAAFAVCIPDGSVEAAAGDDATDLTWIEVTIDDDKVELALPGDGKPAFDHMQIITDAVRKLNL